MVIFKCAQHGIISKYNALNTNMPVGAYTQVFRKRPGCALIGACALIIKNMVHGILYQYHITMRV